MARGTTLEDLIEMYRAEVGRATASSSGVDHRNAEKTIIRRVQEELYDEYDWPHLRMDPYLSLSKGQYWYDLPSKLNYERIEGVYSWWNGDPRGTERGIGPAEYAEFDTDNDERSDPVLKWDFKYNHVADASQLEVWPIPATNDQKLQIVGIRNLNALTAEADRADLDDQLIVLFAAAETLARQKSNDAQAKLSKAERRLNTMKRRVKSGEGPIKYGGGGSSGVAAGRRTIIRVSG